jgi:hypothetical protein
MHLFNHYAAAFPMAPFGGAFILPVGLCVLAGAAWPRWRGRLVIAGFVLGGISISLFTHLLARGSAAATPLQVASFAAALLAEAAGFALILPRMHSERARMVATLSIVAGHFLIMVPAFGPLIAILGLLCLANAAQGYTQTTPQRRLWLIDGALKTLGAALMIATAPLLVAAF